MARFDVAHLHVQGQDLIIVPLGREFGYKSDAEKDDIVGALQACANDAGLAGTVVPVWDAGSGRMAFIAPRGWHPYFQSINLRYVAANLNRALTCA